MNFNVGEHIIMEEAIKTYGDDAQLIQAMEELAELQQALCRYLNGRKNNLLEELADVYIMLEQIKKVTGLTDDAIHPIVATKLTRLENRIIERKDAK